MIHPCTVAFVDLSSTPSARADLTAATYVHNPLTAVSFRRLATSLARPASATSFGIDGIESRSNPVDDAGSLARPPSPRASAGGMFSSNSVAPNESGTSDTGTTFGDVGVASDPRPLLPKLFIASGSLSITARVSSLDRIVVAVAVAAVAARVSLSSLHALFAAASNRSPTTTPGRFGASNTSNTRILARSNRSTHPPSASHVSFSNQIRPSSSTYGSVSASFAPARMLSPLNASTTPYSCPINRLRPSVRLTRRHRPPPGRRHRASFRFVLASLAASLHSSNCTTKRPRRLPLAAERALRSPPSAQTLKSESTLARARAASRSRGATRASMKSATTVRQAGRTVGHPCVDASHRSSSRAVEDIGKRFVRRLVERERRGGGAGDAL